MPVVTSIRASSAGLIFLHDRLGSLFGLRQSRARFLWLVGGCLIYLGLTVTNLGLPGLHYDEAKEAGVNAVELLTDQPVTSFRDIAVSLLGRDLPLMVQDYIGALNVYLALPFLQFTGIGVPNLRFLSVLMGLLALVTLERGLSWWIYIHTEQQGTGQGYTEQDYTGQGYTEQEDTEPEDTEPEDIAQGDSGPHRVPISSIGLIAVLLLAASPSFVFWSRQGIFVTNVIQPLCFAWFWMMARWVDALQQGNLASPGNAMRGGTRSTLWAILAGCLAGLALYGKLLSIWILLPFGLYFLILGWRRGGLRTETFRLTIDTIDMAVAALVMLSPFLLFNLQSGGTISALSSNATESYYGVDNLALGQNFGVRVAQLAGVLRGDHFWYLGGIYANAAAPWLAALGMLLGLFYAWRAASRWLLLLAVSVGLSLFTISDLFITHYALIHPLLVAAAAIGMAGLIGSESGQTGNLYRATARLLAVALVCGWLLLDAFVTVRYHDALNQSGGLADHSDATYDLAYHLRYNGMGAPILLDWGMDAQIRYLSQGTVRPIEIFGYDSVSEPDADFVNRLGLFIDNPDNVYLLHAEGASIFGGRRELFFSEAANRGLEPSLIQTFAQRDGTPLFELWRVAPP